MSALVRSRPGRLLASVLVAWLSFLGALACQPPGSLGVISGEIDYQREGFVPVPGGVVNAAGGNLMLERIDLSIDSVLGTREIRTRYDAAVGAWHWSFEMHLEGQVFTDATGAEHDLTGLAAGEAVSGTDWDVAGAAAVATRGGLEHHFGASGKLSHVAWRGAAYPRITYAWSTDALEMTQCTAPVACLPFYRVSLDASGRPIAVDELRTARRAEYVWDGLGRLVEAFDARAIAEGRPGTLYEYEFAGSLLTAATNAEGERVEYVYQANRRILEVVQIGAGNPTHRFEFNAPKSYTNGWYSTLHTNPVGGRTRYFFDAKRRLRELVRVETGERTNLEWQGLRSVLRTAPNGVTTAVTHANDRVVTRTEPSGNVNRFTYADEATNRRDPESPPLLRLEDDLGLVEERTYDGEGRLVGVANGEGEIVTLGYAGALIVSTIEASGAQRQFPLYGMHGHWLESHGVSEERRRFDPVGNPEIPDSLARGGGVLEHHYDAARELTGLRLAASVGSSVVSEDDVTIARRSDGRPLSVERPGGPDHAFDYDALGRLAARREWLGSGWATTSFDLDLAGHLIARARPNGMREEWERDAYGRIVRRSALRDGVLEGVVDFVWSQGELLATIDSIRGGIEQYAYDAAGRLARIEFAQGESIDRGYDLRSRLVTESFNLPVAQEIGFIQYGYDGANRQVRIESGVNELLLQRQFVGGLLTSVTYGNGLVRDLAYDSDARFVGAVTVDSSGAVMEETELVRSLEVAPLRQQIRTATTTPLASTEEAYWLPAGASLTDPDQAVGKRVFGWSDGVGATRAYDYDALSNPTSDADGDVYGYDPAGRLSSATLAAEGRSIVYTYDDAGFATSRDGVALAWTATGRLASHGETLLAWDMLDRPLGHTDANGSFDLSLFGGRIPRDTATGALGALDLGEVVLDFGSSVRRYRHLDFRRNVSFVSDASGAVIQQHRYAPYGLDASFGAGEEPVGFAGRAGIGELMLLGARVYDPAVGRFLSPDPVFSWVNLYAYAQGNPVWFWDPDGTEMEPLSPEVGALNAGVNFLVSTVLLVLLGAEAGAAVGVLAALSFAFAGFWLAWMLATWLSGIHSEAAIVSPGSRGRLTAPIQLGMGSFELGIGGFISVGL